MYILEKSPDTLRIMSVIKNFEVPYCDCFSVHDELLVKGLSSKPNGKGCVVQ